MLIRSTIPLALVLLATSVSGVGADDAVARALATALEAVDRPGVEAAIGRGADGTGTPLGQESLLSFVAAFNLPSSVRTLVARGRPVDGLDPGGETALFAAAAAGAAAATRALLELGADPSRAVRSRRAPGWTPLFAASASGHDAVVRVLLEASGGGDAAGAVDLHGRTPLFYAALHGQGTVVRLLLDAGAKSDARDEDGETPSSLAAKAGRRAMVDLLGEPAAGRRP